LAAQQPPESQYNPHDSGEGPAAKLWELLRRNPDFRTIACDLLRLKLQKSSHLLHIAEKFQILDVNPFAGFALRWLFRPKFVQFCFPRRPHDFFKPWTTQDWTESGFPWISDEKLRELEEILSDENHHDSYPGPLAVSKGGFTLDTPWPETPELFRFLFSWLWEEYEFGKLSDSEAARFMITGRVPDRGFEIDWTFLDHGTPNIDWETRYNLRRVRFLVENHDLFAIPRVMMTRNDEMRLRETFNMMILENSRFIDIRKYPNFLGNKTDWLVFNFCRAKISYQRDPTKPDEQPLRFGSGKALTEVIDTQRKLGKFFLD